jgi:hypothetical protein
MGDTCDQDTERRVKRDTLGGNDVVDGHLVGRSLGAIDVESNTVGEGYFSGNSLGNSGLGSTNVVESDPLSSNLEANSLHNLHIILNNLQINESEISPPLPPSEIPHIRKPRQIMGPNYFPPSPYIPLPVRAFDSLPPPYPQTVTSSVTTLPVRQRIFTAQSVRQGELYGQVTDRNFPCQTLKIRNVSLVVMGS